MRGRLDEIHAAGAELVFIGNGSVAFAKQFAAREVPGCRVYTDPSRTAYRALGLRRSVAGTLSPRSLAAGLRSTLKGYVQTSVQGDGFQLGGLFAVRPGGEIAFAQVNRDAADRPDLDGALRALSPASAPRAPGSPAAP